MSAKYALIDAVLDGLNSHFAERHLYIVRRLEEVTVVADPMRLTQVVTNLVLLCGYW